MAQIKIDSDALYRAVTATGYKLMAWHLDLSSGKILSRTLRPEEVETPLDADTPSVKPLPKMGGDLSKKKEQNLFGPAVPKTPKKKLFKDDDAPKKNGLESSFFTRAEKKKIDPFGEMGEIGESGFKKISGSKKLAEIFGEAAPSKEKVSLPTPFVESNSAVETIAVEPESYPRIPVATEAQQTQWRIHFARDCGDPQIREELGRVLAGTSTTDAFERLLRKYVRMGQQWESYHRKQALQFAESWLDTLPMTWEWVEK